MFAKFFKAPTVTVDGTGAVTISTFQDDIIFAMDRIVSYEYTKRFSKVGDFSMVLPFDKYKLGQLQINDTIYIDGDWLWVQNIGFDGRQIVISGKDCKGFLDTRVVLPSNTAARGAEGYDVATGPTRTCIKHYIDNHCINPSDGNRKLPLVWVGGAEGLRNDSYMAHFEYVSEVVTALCDNANLGYDIRGNINSSGFGFYVIQGIDRSFAQSENPRVIFSAQWGNIVSQNFEHGVDNLYNVIYGTDTDGYTASVYRDESVSTGVSRRECNVDVSVTIEDEYFNKYALNSVQDNIETHSYEVGAAVSSGYGTEYNLGDIVTVKDDFTGNLFNATITEATKSYSQGGKTLSLVLGQQKAKPLNKIVNNMINKTIRRR